jgi:hypothetical protein
VTNIEGPQHIREEIVTAEPVGPLRAASTGTTFEAQEAPVRATQVRTSYASRYAPDSLIAAAIGLVLLVVGLIAIVRGGFAGPMSEPVVKVVGFTHTTSLGLIEIVAGAVLLISAASRSRSGEVLVGLLLGVAGFVGAVQTKSFVRTLALEKSMAWLVTIAGVVVVAAAMLLPRIARRSTVIEQR